jgi:hypothetical protein
MNKPANMSLELSSMMPPGSEVGAIGRGRVDLMRRRSSTHRWRHATRVANGEAKLPLFSSLLAPDMYIRIAQRLADNL